MIRKLLAATVLPAALAVTIVGVSHGQAEGPMRRLPAPAVQMKAATPGLRTAVFSGGCFWGVEGVFSHVRGVTRAISGYTGGLALTANYETVSTGATGHAESVQVTYDPKVVSYGELLRVFFSVALDPTEVNRQGPDDGSQYRSVVWVSNPAEQKVAQAYIHQLDAAHAFKAPIATRVQPLHGFYPAEAYHQNFMAQHPDYPYLVEWDDARVAALKQLFPDLYAPKALISS
jgi:peptide-methionine (S)-S-oxide reductase